MTDRMNGPTGAPISDPVRPETVLDFWLGELTPEDWYAVDPQVDDRIRSRFGASWERLREGGKQGWLTGCVGALAYVILADQFPRNMFRGGDMAFATDELARAAARQAIGKGWDMLAPEPDRQFFYLPFMHSEDPADQALACDCFDTRMPETGAENATHARAHQEVIRRFGRFPYRNDALGRATTEAEQDFLDAGGYRAAVEAVKAD